MQGQWYDSDGIFVVIEIGYKAPFDWVQLHPSIIEKDSIKHFDFEIFFEYESDSCVLMKL